MSETYEPTNEQRRKSRMFYDEVTDEYGKTPIGMVFREAGKRARELAEWSERSFKSSKRFGYYDPRW